MQPIEPTAIYTEQQAAMMLEVEKARASDLPGGVIYPEKLRTNDRKESG